MRNQLQHDLFRHHLNRCRQIHLASRDLRIRLPRRATEERVEPRIGHQRRIEIAECLRVQPDGAVIANLDQFVADHLREARFPVWGQPHQLVLARVDLESAVVRERAVEQAERVRIAHFLQQLDVRSIAGTDRAGRPFADAIDRQDRGALKR